MKAVPVSERYNPNALESKGLRGAIPVELRRCAKIEAVVQFDLDAYPFDALRSLRAGSFAHRRESVRPDPSLRK